MAIQGSIDSISLPDLFSLISQLRKTGVLSLVTRVEERSFLFYEGHLVHATSREESRRLGQFLMKLGFVQEAEIEELDQLTADGESYLGRRLLESGKLEQKQLSSALRAQVLDILREVLTWTEGAFLFDDRDPPFEVLDENLMSTQSVLLEAARMTDEQSYVQSLFPDPSLVPVRVEAEGHEELDEDVQTVFDLVDGERSVDELFLVAKGGPSAIAAHLKSLLDTGRLRVRDEEGVADADRLASMHLCPLSPETPGLLYASLTSEFVDEDAVTRILASEPMLTVKVVRLLNLNGNGVDADSLSVSSLAHRLGDFQLRCLLLAEAARGLSYPARRGYNSELWEHSRHCAQLCRFLAIETGYHAPSEAYLAGLIHNLGAFLLSQSDAEKYQEVLADSIRERRDINEIEAERFGQTHVEIGAFCARRWGIPDVLLQVIEYHHDPEAAQLDELLQIVAVANGLAQASGHRVGHHAGLGMQFEDSLRRLELDRQLASSLYQRILSPQGVEEMMEETCESVEAV